MHPLAEVWCASTKHLRHLARIRIMECLHDKNGDLDEESVRLRNYFDAFHLSVSELPTHFALSTALNSLTYTTAGFPAEQGEKYLIDSFIVCSCDEGRSNI